MIEFSVYEASRERVADRVRGALAHDPIVRDGTSVTIYHRGDATRRRVSHALRRLSDWLDPPSHTQTAPADGC